MACFTAVMVTITDVLGRVFGGGRPSDSTPNAGGKGTVSPPVLNPLDPQAKNVATGTINGLNGVVLKMKCLNTKPLVVAGGKPVRTWTCAQDGDPIVPPPADPIFGP